MWNHLDSGDDLAHHDRHTVIIIIIIIMVLTIISILLIVIISIAGVDLATGQKPLFERSPFFDMAMIKDMSKADADKMFDDLDVHPSPRLIKTHYPFELLPANLLETCKVIHMSGLRYLRLVICLRR